MANLQTSPISQLLNTLGLTREDLSKRSREMRQFLTTDDSSRVFDTVEAITDTSIHSGSRPPSLKSSVARSLSCASSSCHLDASPPMTPIKSEPSDISLPARPVDTMEAVIERQRLARKEKRHRREREKEAARSAGLDLPSPTPSRHASLSRSGSQRSYRHQPIRPSVSSPSTEVDKSPSPPPLTPSHSKYYREHTMSKPPSTIPNTLKTETPVKSRTLTVTSAPSPYYPPSVYQKTLADASFTMITPNRRRVPRPLMNSPLPPSSPPDFSPASSPIKNTIKEVSSPGPATAGDYDVLPYTLPSGPYSPHKPDLSYAALLGRAILSSPEHRLTLQEIYDWITTVFPFFKRGETTWMNSIRHVLSTTVCFRKVTRDRTLGRTLWAIWDEDLECFKDGGFRKQFCRDMNITAKEGKGKRSRKQTNDDEPEPKAKRAKKDRAEPRANQQYILPHPNFTIGPTPHQQSYYDSCAMSQPHYLNGTIFPSMAMGTIPAVDAVASGQAVVDEVPSSPPDEHSVFLSGALHSSASSSSFQSIPALTPNRSSSSPPPSTSDFDVDTSDVFSYNSLSDRDDDNVLPADDGVFTSTKLTPVQFWGSAPRTVVSKPRMKLTYGLPDDIPELGANLMGDPDQSGDHHNFMDYLIASPSPTIGLRAKVREKSKQDNMDEPVVDITKLTRPIRSSTPPKKASTSTCNLQLSPIRTPISHRGLHMSPSPSLAYYKNHLNPPPPLVRLDEEDDLMRTPSRKRSDNPVTPKRLFPFSDSPFRTPTQSILSPFRIGGVYDHSDTHSSSSMLVEDLNRRALMEQSPSGIFGKKHRDLLYSSPGFGDADVNDNKWW